MIGLVFSAPQSKPDQQQDDKSWWCNVKPGPDWSKAIAEQMERWTGKGSSLEPTARKIRPRWQQSWKKNSAKKA
jgi:hypothetical protein